MLAGIEFKRPAEMALGCIVFTPHGTDLAEQPVAAALLRVEVDRPRGHRERRVQHRGRRGCVTIACTSHEREVRLRQREPATAELSETP